MTILVCDECGGEFDEAEGSAVGDECTRCKEWFPTDPIGRLRRHDENEGDELRELSERCNEAIVELGDLYRAWADADPGLRGLDNEVDVADGRTVRIRIEFCEVGSVVPGPKEVEQRGIARARAVVEAWRVKTEAQADAGGLSNSAYILTERAEFLAEIVAEIDAIEV